MVEINNKPFLDYQLELLAGNEITEVVLLLGHLWEKVQDHFGSNFKSPFGKGIKLVYSIEPRYLGTAGAIKNAEKFISDHFFVLYGDTYLPIDYQLMATEMLEKGATGIISVYDNHKKIVNNNVTISKDGYVIKYNKLSESSDMNGVEAGVSAFNKRILNMIPKLLVQKQNQKISLEQDIYPKLINQNQLLGYMTDIRFFDIGTPERLKIISEVLK